jgi:hypothetical protein
MEMIQNYSGEANDLQRWKNQLMKELQSPRERSFLHMETINTNRPQRILTYAEYTAWMEIIGAYLYLKHEIESHDTIFVVLRCRGGMPPSAANHQIVGETDRLNELAHQTYHKYLFDDIPTADGMVRLEEAKTHLNNINRGNATLWANVTGADPRVGNATITAQYTDRCISARIVLLSMIKRGSQLSNFCGSASFTDGETIWTYLNGPMVVYLRPDDDVAQEHIREVTSWTYLDMPVAQQDGNLCLNFAAKLTNHNPLLHPNYDINHGSLLRTYIHGLHPEAKLLAIQMKDNLTLAAQNGCCFPTNYPAHHPLNGAHPNAGQLSMQLLKIYLHKQFTMKVRAGVIRLKGTPQSSINATEVTAADSNSVATDQPSSSTAIVTPPSPNGSDFEWVSLNMLGDYQSFCDYSLYVLQRPANNLRTCRNCGGVNHFSHKDGVLVCTTPEGSVPASLLKNIRYPLGVTPWRFGSGKGKGKGAKGGKGRYGGRGNGGRGRGGYWMQYDDGEWAWHVAAEEPQQEEEEQRVDFIIDDYDGFNQ